LKLPISLMNMPDEINRLARSPMAGPRIVRIFANSVSLADNASIIKEELSLQMKEAKMLDGLFTRRIKAKTAEG